MQITLYHNARCSTSRNILALLRERGLDVTIIEYLKTPPDRVTLQGLAEASGVGIRGLLRAKEALAGELGLTAPDVSEDRILDAMVANPVLLNRPIVVTPLGVRLCRPPACVEEVLPAV
ncbi:arsenate reductase (glutaredoxin) [Acetobacter conturbans]|uniref:Arsenate reductase n=1 Tax=Acetobacter conturbans TaxID=1737472 RepID=A0ABX0K019_9PROT|nr:arsenate reductase (glutaredoxin) [Acetobacter conturbans]NHN87084.1 arsenate reductase (glutaredoxin) [Acetobacter conturbans]